MKFRPMFGLRNPMYDNMVPEFKRKQSVKYVVAYLIAVVKCSVGTRKPLWWIIDVVGRKATGKGFS